MAGAFPGPLNLTRAVKQLQKLQEDMARVQQELSERTVEASVGGGAVTAVADGGLRIRSVRIDPAAVESGDIEMLQDLVVAAVNEALRRAKEMGEEAVAQLTGQLGQFGIPGLSGLKPTGRP